MKDWSLIYKHRTPLQNINTNKTMVSSKLLVVALFLLFSYSFAKLHGTLIDRVANLLLVVASKVLNHAYVFPEGAEKGACKFHSNGDCLTHAKEGNGKGCHFAGTCSSGGDCRQACAALGRNPDAVECVTSTGENRCCCIDI